MAITSDITDWDRIKITACDSIYALAAEEQK